MRWPRATRRRKYHALTRPPELEGEATSRAIQLARVAGSPLYVVHVSCTDSIGPIERAREAGWNVWGETCSQYLLVDYSYDRSARVRGRQVRLHAAAAREAPPRGAVGGAAHRHALGGLDRPRALQLPRAEGHGQGRLLEDPERPGRHRGAAQGPARVRRPQGQDRSQPHGPAVGDEPREALRPLPPQGHHRGRQRRRHRHLRSQEEAHDVGQDAPLELRLQPLRGHRGHRRAGDA